MRGAGERLRHMLRCCRARSIRPSTSRQADSASARVCILAPAPCACWWGPAAPDVALPAHTPCMAMAVDGGQRSLLGQAPEAPSTQAAEPAGEADAAPAAATSPAAAAAPCPWCAARRKTLLQDRLFSLLCFSLWTITSIKSALATPLLTEHNVQTLVGAAASELGAL